MQARKPGACWVADWSGGQGIGQPGHGEPDAASQACLLSLFPRLRAGSKHAVSIPYKYVKLRSGLPGGYDARENAEELVAERPGYRVVRGWLMSPGGILDKHFIVENIQTGQRFDMTPLDRRTPFFEHPGTIEEFDGLWHQISMPPYSPAVQLVIQNMADIVRGASGAAPDEGLRAPRPDNEA